MKHANLAAMVLAASSFWGATTAMASNDPAATGRLISVNGGVLVQRAMQTDIASIGAIVGVGDMILTTDTGTTQWQMSDTSLFAMAPDSGLKINKYALPNQKNTAGVASYTLLKGAVHTITGKIGQAVAAGNARNVYSSAAGPFSPANLIKVAAAPSSPYMLKTATATIDTKGADYLAVQGDKQLQVMVRAGSVTVCTVSGCASPNAGESAVVACEGCKPTVAAGSSPDLNDLIASLEFNLKAPAAIVNTDQVSDPRATKVSPTEGCRTVAAHLEDPVNCQGFERPPVSPN